MTTTTFSFEHVAISINGVPVSCFWEGDDVVTVTPHADTITPMIGAGGCPLISVSTDRAAIIALKLQHTSPSHKFLTELHQQMRLGNITTFVFSVVDTQSFEGGVAKDCLLMAKPVRTYGANATQREWRIFAGEWVDSATSIVEAIS